MGEFEVTDRMISGWMAGAHYRINNEINRWVYEAGSRINDSKTPLRHFFTESLVYVYHVESINKYVIKFGGSKKTELKRRHKTVSFVKRPTIIGGAIALGTLDGGVEVLQAVNAIDGTAEIVLIVPQDVLGKVSSMASYYMNALLNLLDTAEKKEEYSYAPYIRELELALAEFKNLVYDPNTLERLIDKHLELQPELLQIGLGLESTIHQPRLEDVNGTNNQVYIPDVIGYSPAVKQWVIVDYKLARGSVLRRKGKSRVWLKSEVMELQSQLQHYREYFNDSKQREDFRNGYMVEIKTPIAIGLVGKVEEADTADFNQVKDTLANWFEIVPYNYMIERIEKHIEMIKGLHLLRK